MNESYRITKWWDRHSSAEQRRLNGRAVLMPTSFDSLGYKTLVQTPKGCQAFGVYCALAELAGKLPTADAWDTAGTLANDQGALNAGKIALLIAMPTKVVGAALDLLETPDIGWIERVPTPTILPGAPPGGDADSPGMPPGHSRDHPEPSRTCAGGSSKQANVSLALPASSMQAVRAMLERVGVSLRSVKPDMIEGVSSADLLAHWHDTVTRPSVRNPERLLARKLRDHDEPPALKPEAVVRAVNDGIVTQATIAGEVIDLRGAKYNRDGISRDGDVVIATNELTQAEYA